jgi:hypothetical protein
MYAPRCCVINGSKQSQHPKPERSMSPQRTTQDERYWDREERQQPGVHFVNPPGRCSSEASQTGLGSCLVAERQARSIAWHGKVGISALADSLLSLLVFSSFKSVNSTPSRTTRDVQSCHSQISSMLSRDCRREEGE